MPVSAEVCVPYEIYTNNATGEVRTVRNNPILSRGTSGPLPTGVTITSTCVDATHYNAPELEFNNITAIDKMFLFANIFIFLIVTIILISLPIILVFLISKMKINKSFKIILEILVVLLCVPVTLIAIIQILVFLGIY